MTVILAAGDYPKKTSKAHTLLESATRVVACDGAAKRYIKEFGKGPDYVIGDLDGLGVPGICAVMKAGSELIQVPDQDTNDLAKAIDFCRSKGWEDIVVLGASGKREDHAMANAFLALDKKVKLISDYGTFFPVDDELELDCRLGQPVSIFATDPDTRVTSEGLAWPLDNHKFTTLYSATLNRTNAEKLRLKTDRPILVYIAL